MEERLKFNTLRRVVLSRRRNGERFFTAGATDKNKPRPLKKDGAACHTHQLHQCQTLRFRSVHETLQLLFFAAFLTGF